MDETLLVEFDNNDVITALQDYYFKTKGRNIDICFGKDEQDKKDVLPYQYRNIKVQVKVWTDDRPPLEEIKGEIQVDHSLMGKVSENPSGFFQYQTVSGQGSIGSLTSKRQIITP